MDLDDELRRMFANSGDQLDVPIRPDAEQAIVAGAGRRRKRRLAAMSASGAAAVVVVVAVGIALANPTPEAMPPAHVPTSTSSSPTPPSQNEAPPTEPGTGIALPPAAPPTGEEEPPQGTTEEPPPPPEVTGEEIGPFGWRELRLGMTYEEAVATGLVVETGAPPGPGCNTYTIATADGSHGGAVHISQEFGVDFIAPYVKVHTPEGVSEGWTIEQFLVVYPELADEVAQSSSVTIPVAGNSAAEYRIDHLGTGTIQMVALQLTSPSC